MSLTETVCCSGGGSDCTDKCVTKTHLVASRHERLWLIPVNMSSVIMSQTLLAIHMMVF